MSSTSLTNWLTENWNMRAILITLHPNEEVVVLINVLAADYEVAQLKQIPLARNFLSCCFFSREQEMSSGFRIFSKTWTSELQLRYDTW